MIQLNTCSQYVFFYNISFKKKINLTSNDKRAYYTKRRIFNTTLKIKLHQYTYKKIYMTLDYTSTYMYLYVI